MVSLSWLVRLKTPKQVYASVRLCLFWAMFLALFGNIPLTTKKN